MSRFAPLGGADDTSAMSEVSGDVTAREPRSWRWAALFVLPYLVLAVTWSVTNPPGAAPDEPDNLVKAIGSGSFSVGEPGPGAPSDEVSLLVKRNASITRVYSVPTNLGNLQSYVCFAFKPDVTAACLPDESVGGAGSVDRATPIGAYPPFLYVPIGWAVIPASAPESAFLLARLAISLLSSALLLVGVRHLIRWLGRSAVLGVVALLTPMAVYTTGIVSLSGVELTAAIGVASVVTVAVLRPESVHVPATHWTLLVSGGTLALSRQLGAVTLAAMIVVLLMVTGWTRIRRLVADRQPSFVVTVGLLFISALAVAAWELRYDHPSDTGSALNPDAIGPFFDRSYQLVESAVGKFGWLDTPLPVPMTGLWVGAWIIIIGSAALLATRREFLLILGSATATWVLAFCIYSSVFFTVGADVQGRQFMPFAAFAFILSGAVLLRHLQTFGAPVTTRLYLLLAVSAGIGQVFAIFWNGRRYAVGDDGPIWFFSQAEWSPVLGWGVWTLLACIGGILLALVIFQSRPAAATGARLKGVVEHV